MSPRVAFQARIRIESPCVTAGKEEVINCARLARELSRHIGIQWTQSQWPRLAQLGLLAMAGLVAMDRYLL